ncbi:MAG: N-acetylmuramoyl-L-alanine amidase [Gemella haemolysans]|nr:N-acetylmuramoyl-L-alanine amidase [Gemella haemolysans]
MRIKRKNKNGVFLAISALLLILVIAGLINFIGEKLNPSANAQNIITISKEIELRTGPDDTYPTLKKVTAGDNVEMLSKSETWYEVKTNDSYVGWLPGWSILGTGQKSPEDQNKEKLKSYSILLNPINSYEDNHDYKGTSSKTYNLRVAKQLKEILEKDGIKVILSRENDETYPSKEEITKIASENSVEMLLDIDVFNDSNKDIFGVKVYYGTQASSIVARSIERNLTEHYLSKISSSEKQANFSQLSDKLPQVKLIAGNIGNKIDVDLLNNEIANKQFIESLRDGVEGYLYYLINVDNYNAKRKEQLLNLPQKGLAVPMYYMKQDAYKNISYGLDGKKIIEDNGDAIISLAMIAKYVGKDEATVENLASWAGNKYYIRNQGTQPTIITAFAEKYNLKVERIETDKLVENLENALKDNKPILVRLKSGVFGNRVTYKVIRGYEDDKFYINDPNDDDVKLTSYNGFTENDIKNNLVQAWVFSK